MSAGIVAERPKCHACGAFMELRGKTGHATPEQKFCGIWYDHPQTSGGVGFGHAASVLLPSPALLQQEFEMTRSAVPTALFEMSA